MPHMNNWLRWCCSIACGGALLAGMATAAETPASWPDEVNAVIRQLADPNPEVRDEAARALWRMGPTAEPALQRLAKLPDPEISGRAKQILIDIRYGIYPDTPADIVEQVRIYQAGDLPARRDALRALVQMEARAMPYLVRLSKAEPDEAMRREIDQRLSLRALQAAPAFLAEGDAPMAVELLERAAAAGLDEGARSLATYVLLTGGIEPRIAELRRQMQADAETPGAAHLLAQLYRIKGDLPAARKLAEQTGRDELIDAILAQQNDFAALAQRHADEVKNPTPDIELLGLLAMSQRLSGSASLDKTLRAITDLPERHMDKAMVPYCGELLLLNGRPDLAIPVLTGGQAFDKAFDLLAGQHRYREAIALADGRVMNVRLPIPPEAFRAKAGAARLLYYLGDTERGNAQFDGLAARLATRAVEDRDFRLHRAMIVNARQARQYDRALSYCAVALERDPSGVYHGLIHASLSDDKAGPAAAWHWFFRRQHAQEPVIATLRRVSRVLAGGLPPEELDTLARSAASEAAADPKKNAAVIHGIAQTLESAGRIELARELLLKQAQASESSDEYMMLGVTALKRQRWAEAAGHYAAAVARDPTGAAPRYLQGHALTKIGRVDQGKKLIELANLLPLGDQQQRYILAEALRGVGLVDEAEQQYQLIAQSGRWMTIEMGNALRRLSRLAQQRGDWKQAVRHAQLSIFDCLDVQIQYTEFASYLGGPASILRMQAAGLLAEGKVDAALEQVEQALRILPGEIMLAIDLHPLLIKAGRPEEAARLLDRILAHKQAALTDYPRSAGLHNAVAWMLARCARKLDVALEHAQKGVDLEPNNAAILDTLAEVHFQLGQKDKAIEALRRCIALEPDNARHKLALTRFETSTPDTEPPPED